jgi:myo-inositol-1(or 4)-monophosphatase
MSIPLDFTIDLARKAGQLIIAERDQAQLEHSYKYGNELVTSADLKADRLIVDTIKAQFPDHYILSEESSPELGDIDSLDQPVWIIDPIDGTVNFAHGHSQSAVSIAFASAGMVECGVVFNPFTDELFAARRGAGATLNGKALAVAEETDLSRAIIATGFPYDKSTLEPMLQRVQVVLRHCADIRRLGAAALDICWVAAGRLDGYYESLSLWDHAAAQLIAREAGAETGHFSPVPEGVNPQFHSKDIVVAGPALYPQLRRLLQSADAGITP